MTELLGGLTALGDALAAWLVPALLWSALLLVLVRAADELLSRRVSASWRVALYAVVLLRLALPAGWETPLGLLPGEAPPAALELAAVESVSWAVAPAEPLAASAPVPPAAPRVAWTAALPVVHALGALAFLAWMLLSRRRLEAELAGAVPARDELAALAPRQRVLEHDAVGPAVAGVLRPRIVVPRSLVELLDRASLSAVLRHEAAHCERRDPLLQAGVQLVLALLWPVLPLWLAAHRVRQLVEEACDERALRGQGADERRAYGETLLAVAVAGPGPVRPALGLLRFGAALRSRLKALRFARRWPVGLQAALVITCLATVALASGRRPVAGSPVDEKGMVAADGAARVITAKVRVSQRLDLDVLPADLAALAGPAEVDRLAPSLDWRAAFISADLAEDLNEALATTAEPETEPVKRARFVSSEPGVVGFRWWGTHSRALVIRLSEVGVSQDGEVVFGFTAEELEGTNRLLLRRWSLNFGSGDGQTVHVLLPDERDGRSDVRLVTIELEIEPADRPTRLRHAGRVEYRESSDDAWHVLGSESSLPPGTELRLEPGATLTLPDEVPEPAVLRGPSRLRIETPVELAPGPAPNRGTLLRAEEVVLSGPGSAPDLELAGSAWARRVRRAAGLALEPELPWWVLRDLGTIRAIADGRATLMSVEVDSDFLVRVQAHVPDQAGVGRLVKDAEAAREWAVRSISITRGDPDGLNVFLDLKRLGLPQLLVNVRVVELTAGARLPAWTGLEAASGGQGVVLDEDFELEHLDAELAAAEAGGILQIVSAPRIVVQLGEEAEVESGVARPTPDDPTQVGSSMRANIKSSRGPDDRIVLDWSLTTGPPNLTAEAGGLAELGRTVVLRAPAEEPGRELAVWILGQALEEEGAR